MLDDLYGEQIRDALERQWQARCRPITLPSQGSHTFDDGRAVSDKITDPGKRHSLKPGTNYTVAMVDFLAGGDGVHRVYGRDGSSLRPV